MGGAIEASEKQATSHSYSFYDHSLVTRHNNMEHFISINFIGIDIHLSICKLLSIDHAHILGMSMCLFCYI